MDGPAEQEFANLGRAAQMALTALLDAVVIADPVQYQRRPDEPSDPPAPLRSLHFGQHHEGLVTLLIYPPDDLVLVVRVQWLGE